MCKHEHISNEELRKELVDAVLELKEAHGELLLAETQAEADERLETVYRQFTFMLHLTMHCLSRLHPEWVWERREGGATRGDRSKGDGGLPTWRAELN